MLNWLKDKGNETRSRLSAEVSKFKNRTFMEATVAACALVAAADGTVSSEEKQKMAGFIRNSDELKHFSMTDVIAFFEKVIGNFDFDPEISRAEALKVIGRLRGNVEQALVMVRVAGPAGRSGGHGRFHGLPVADRQDWSDRWSDNDRLLTAFHGRAVCRAGRVPCRMGIPVFQDQLHLN